MNCIMLLLFTTGCYVTKRILFSGSQFLSYLWCHAPLMCHVIYPYIILFNCSFLYQFFNFLTFAALARFAFGHNRHLKSVAAAYWKPQPNSVLTSLPSFAVKSSGSGYTTPTQNVAHGGIVPSTVAPLLKMGESSQSGSRDGRASTSSPLATSGLMHGSPMSDDSSQHSDPGILNDCISNGVVNHVRPRPLDNALYSQCVLAMCTLAKDPSPRIASLGRRVLSIIGIEQVVAKSVKSISASGRLSEPKTNPLARSSSWFDMNGGKLS